MGPTFRDRLVEAAVAQLRLRGTVSKANGFVYQDVLDVIEAVEGRIREDERRRIEEGA